MGAKSSKEGDRELSPVTKIRGKAERAVATAARGGYSSGSSSSVNSSMNQSKNSRTGPTSSKWPRQTPPPSDAWGQKTQKSSKPPQSNRLIEEEENEDDPFRGKEIHSGLTVTDLPLVSSRNDPSGGSRNRDTSPPKPAKPKKRNSDPFAHFKNVTELRDIKDAKENKPPPPEPSRPPWRKPATPPPQPYLKKGGARGTTHPTENSSDKESKGPPVRNKKSLPKKGGGGGGAKKQSSFSPEKKNSASDVSTLEMDADPSPEHFKKIESAPKFSRSLNVPKKGSEDESDTKGGKPQRSKSSSPPSTRKRKEKKGTNRRPRPLKSSFSFSNIASAKSTTQSLDSASSNFEHRTKVEKFRDKMDSLADAGLAHKNPHLNNQFHDQKIIGLQSYEKAKSDCGSDDWEREIKGIEMIVSISRDKPEILRADINFLVRLMMSELKNLRSQVSRAAGQAYAELFLNLGRYMEKELDKTVPILLQKAADTNKFIRESCQEALDMMAEHVTVLTALQCVVSSGAGHKSPIVRTASARIVDKIVTALGADRVMGCSKEFQEIVFKSGSKFLIDSCVDVRKHARHYFGELVAHKKFDSLLHQFTNESERRDIKKTLDTLH